MTIRGPKWERQQLREEIKRQELEILGLRTERSNLLGTVRLHKEQAEALRAEVEKLRAALEDIAYPNPLHNEDDLMRIARAAITQETRDD